MLWVAQSKTTGHILGIFRKEDNAFATYGDNDNVNIYWVESDL